MKTVAILSMLLCLSAACTAWAADNQADDEKMYLIVHNPSDSSIWISIRPAYPSRKWLPEMEVLPGDDGKIVLSDGAELFDISVRRDADRAFWIARDRPLRQWIWICNSGYISGRIGWFQFLGGHWTIDQSGRKVFVEQRSKRFTLYAMTTRDRDSLMIDWPGER